MNILITGAAGFIGYHLTKNLCKQNKINNVIGIDNLNAYYDIKLKIARLGELGFSKKNISLNKYYKSKKFKNLRFIKSNIDNYKSLDKTNKYQNNNIYNIGNNKPVKLLEFINIIEKNLKTKANLEMLPLQDGDVKRTWASIDRLIMDYNYKPKTSIENGIKKFVAWFNKYHNK